MRIFRCVLILAYVSLALSVFTFTHSLALVSASTKSGGYNYASAEHEAAKGYYNTQLRGGKLLVTVDPGEVPADFVRACGSRTPSWFFRVTINEIAGEGITIDEFKYIFYDHNMQHISTATSTAADFVNIFSNCGATGVRINPNSQLCGSLCVDLGGRTSGFLELVFTGTPDGHSFKANFCSPIITLLGPKANQGADLSVSDVFSATTVTQAKRIYYLITVSNAGPEIATGVNVRSFAPAGTTFNSISLSQGAATTPAVGATGEVSCLLDSIAPGSSAQIWLAFNVTASAVFPFTHTATVTSASNDPNTGNNSASVSAFLGPIFGGKLESDLSIANNSPPESGASGTRLTYNITVKNAGPDSTVRIFDVIDLLPVGATFASITSTRPGVSCTTPPIGSGGAVACQLPSMEVNESLTLTLKVNVLGPPGSVLSNLAEVVSGVATRNFIASSCPNIIFLLDAELDPKPEDNILFHSTFIRGGGLISLGWSIPPPSFGDPTPPPRNLRPGAGGGAPTNPDLSEISITPSADACALIGYKLLISDSSFGLNDPSNVWKTAPPGRTNISAPNAPGGSHYALVAVYRCPDGSIKDSLPSNEVAVPGGAELKKVTATSKLKITGSGFINPVQVFIDGVGFSRNASAQSNAKIVQKGSLANGKSIAEALAPGKTVLITVLNGDGGISSLSFTR